MSTAKRIQDCLRYHRELTSAQIAEKLRLQIDLVTCTLKDMQRKDKAHICAWLGFKRAVYAHGPGESVPRPAPQGESHPMHAVRGMRAPPELLALYGLLPRGKPTGGRIHKLPMHGNEPGEKAP
jgi:hypothetical protein